MTDASSAFVARTWQQRIDAYERLVRLDKPIGILLLLWPTLAALWLAAVGRPALTLVVVFTVGTVLMRCAGCALNDWADRNFDAHVTRTADRPLARGEIEPWEALVVAAAMAAGAFILVAYGTNLKTVRFSVVALAIAAAYPFCKRFFALPQAFLGIAFSFGIPMAFMSVYGTVLWWGWALFAANLFWVVAYDTHWSIATTMSVLDCAPPHSRSGASTSSRSRAVTEPTSPDWRGSQWCANWAGSSGWALVRPSPWPDIISGSSAPANAIGASAPFFPIIGWGSPYLPVSRWTTRSGCMRGRWCVEAYRPPRFGAGGGVRRARADPGQFSG